MNSSFKNNFNRLLKFFSPYKVRGFFAILSLFVTALCVLLYGLTAKTFIDEGISLGDGSQVNLFFASFVGLTFLLSLSGYFRSYLINGISLDVADNLRRKIFANCLHFGVVFFDNKGSSDIVSRINTDISELFAVFTKNVTFFLRNIVLFMGAIVFLLTLNAELFGVMLLVIVLSTLPIFILVKKLKVFSAKSKEFNSEKYSFMEESFSFIKAIKSFTAEEKSRQDFAKISDKFLSNEKLKSAMQSSVVGVSIFFAFFAVALVLYLGALDVLGGTMSAGDFSSFVFYAVILSVSLVGIAQSISQILSICENSKRVFELLDYNREDFDEGCDLGSLNADGIEFNDVSFSYPGKSDQKVLDNLSFKIKKGQKIAICGDSGQGKSSIFSLLLRFYEITDGKILINGRSIGEYGLKSLRSAFSYVMQDSFIFSGTIFDNIVYPGSAVSKDEVRKVISSSKAFSFIDELTDGIDSDIGSVGSKLSGGQKQRISILRALFSDSQILIFDEATSALDSKNESLMIELINKYSKGKVVIFVSHKPNEDLKFDQVIDV